MPLLIAAAAVSAQANLTPLQTQTVSSTPLSFHQNVSFTGFDTSLGTLTDVLIGGSAGVSLQVQVLNYTSNTLALTDVWALQPIQIENSALTTTWTSVEAQTYAGPTNPGTINGFAVTDYVSLPVGNTVPPGFTTYPGTASMVSFTMPTADITTGLAAYEGVATTVTLAFNAPNGSAGGDGDITNNMLLGPIGNAQGTVTIQYEYTPNETAVPEPATAGLGALAMGLLGLATLRRRRPA